MARQNRRDIFDPNEVGAFHAVQRTVRRAWLCGMDPLSGKSFEHRRTWIQNRLQELAASFGIDCLSFAVMVNHVHVILRNRPDVVAGWSDEEVAQRWWQLFPLRKNKDKTAAVPTESELKLFMSPARSKQLRSRLSDISWWMRALAEPIARRSNSEDKCTGRFWEGRFKCQKLADETAILACSAYVDLNPVRAGVAEVPEESQYTSVYERVQAEKASRKEKARAKVRRRQGRYKGPSIYVLRRFAHFGKLSRFSVHFDPVCNCGRLLWLGRIDAIFSTRMRLELFMPFREPCAARGSVEWILSPANRSSIVGRGSKIDCKNLPPALELIAYPLL